MDWYRTEDTRQALELQSGQGSLWTQIAANTEPIIAKQIVDRFGRLYTQIEIEMIPVADRADPTIITMQKIDWKEDLGITRNVMPKNSQIAMSGIYYEDTKSALAYFSASAGHVFKRFGDSVQIERLLLEDQAQCNELAGLLGHANPKITLSHYASIINSKTIDLGRDFDLFDTFSSQSKEKSLLKSIK